MRSSAYFATEISNNENGPNSSQNKPTENQASKSMRVVKQFVTYVSPDSKNLNCSLLVIDEAAAIPVSHVKPLIIANNCPVFISSTMLDRKFTLRMAALAFRTHRRTIDLLMQILREQVTAIPR